MKKLIVAPDCGNAPRKVFLKEWYQAYLDGSEAFFEKNIAENASWNIAGSKAVEGGRAFLSEIQKHPLWKAGTISIHTIITHGKEASVSGEWVSAGEKAAMFCEVFRFKSAGSSQAENIITFTA